MSTIAEKVPDIELHIPGGKKESKNKGTNIGHQQYLKDVSGKLLYNISLACTRDMAVPNCKGAWGM